MMLSFSVHSCLKALRSSVGCCTCRALRTSLMGSATPSPKTHSSRCGFFGCTGHCTVQSHCVAGLSSTTSNFMFITSGTSLEFPLRSPEQILHGSQTHTRGFAADSLGADPASNIPFSNHHMPGSTTAAEEEESILDIRARIFGQPIKKGERTGRRAMAKRLVGAEMASWYFLPPREVPGFHNEEAEYILQRTAIKRHKKDPGAEEVDKKKKRKK